MPLLRDAFSGSWSDSSKTDHGLMGQFEERAIANAQRPVSEPSGRARHYPPIANAQRPVSGRLPRHENKGQFEKRAPRHENKGQSRSGLSKTTLRIHDRKVRLRYAQSNVKDRGPCMRGSALRVRVAAAPCASTPRNAYTAATKQSEGRERPGATRRTTKSGRTCYHRVIPRQSDQTGPETRYPAPPG
jgi:hypothetical protein